ncbi:hypothetical protein [Aequorivita sp. KMM 9714]|nr:hypothetical protein [Aequorivita sp. KMM 9714]NGX84493.1 hypothetical protein [Aequorivita sp. KMM 9714]
MKYITSLLFMICAQFVIAQEVVTIQGKVIDIDNNPTPFASVYISEIK